MKEQRNGNGRRLRDAMPRLATTRVAVYTRQSVDKGPDQDMTSCEAQREGILAYIESQRGEGWAALPDRYDDGGYSGATTSRPALQRLLDEVERGTIDVIAVYKIDRISRSLIDFTTIMRKLEKHGVGFVSVTQHFNTASSTGALMMNLLMSFAQFEREQIAERIKDKFSAMRRNGYWTVGAPPYGYRSEKGHLVPREDEAPVAREIFKLYLDLESQSLVAAELDRRGIQTRQGRRWHKQIISRILTTVALTGKIPYEGKVYDGRHEAIIDEDTYAAAQQLLSKNRQNGGAHTRNKWGVLLRGLLYCRRCGYAMIHKYSSRGSKKWHYYLCRTKNIALPDACEGTSIACHEIEAFVVSKIREIGKDPAVLAETIHAAQEEARAKAPELSAESRRLMAEIRTLREQRDNLMEALATAGSGAHAIGERIGQLDEQIGKLEGRRNEVQTELITMESEKVNEDDIRAALTEFDGIWGQLVAKEKARLLNLLIERIDYDAEGGEVAIRYRPCGIRSLGGQA